MKTILRPTSPLFRTSCLAAFAILAASAASAAIEPVSPINGEVVERIPDAQRKVMDLPTLEDRIALFREDREHGGKVIRHDKFWRKAKPLKLTWRTTEGEKGPWKIEIGTDRDLGGADIRYVSVKSDNLKVDGDSVTFTMPRANLEIARTYYWRVSGVGKPAEGQKKGSIVRSDIVSFATEDRAPRWIAIEGRVSNIRDFGGWRTTDGRRVRQGMAFRGEGLNDNAGADDFFRETQGRNRLTVEDVRYFTKTLGIKTDLDLRSPGETVDLDESPLGPGVKFILRSSSAYKSIFHDHGKKVMAENVRVFCDPANYPLYFHCIGGADRTGSLAYVLLGTLGVPQHDIETDWESTFYPNIPDGSDDPKELWRYEAHLTDGIGKYGAPGDSWQRRCELYLLDCGITPEEIARLRKILLEPATR